MKCTAALVLALLVGCSGYQRKLYSEPAQVQSVALLATVDRCVNATVQVIATNEVGQGISRGSGVVVGRNTVLTARHMCEGSAKAWVVRQGTVISEAFCVKLGAGPQDDWAVLVLTSPVGHPVDLVDSWGPTDRLHAEAVAVGYALGLPSPSVTVGHIQEPYGTQIRMSAPIIFGNSGGGLFVLEGGELRLAGITVAVFTSGPSPVCHLGLSVSVREIVRQGGLTR
jgi:S1-C subfamily serine protease